MSMSVLSTKKKIVITKQRNMIKLIVLKHHTTITGTTKLYKKSNEHDKVRSLVAIKSSNCNINEEIEKSKSVIQHTIYASVRKISIQERNISLHKYKRDI